MKRCLILLIMLVVKSSFSQVVITDTIKVNEKKGVYSYDLADSLKIDYNKLETEYKNLWDETLNDMNNNSTGSPFEVNQMYQKKPVSNENISSEWNFLLQNISNFLYKNNFIFEEPVSISVKFLFDENGNIDYLFYHSKNRNLDNNSFFIDLLSKFIKIYKFDIKVGRKYSQYGSIVFSQK